jgi:4-oxalocrotonate tautomerase
MCGQECFLRARHIPFVQADPPELVEGPPQLAPQVRAQFVAGDERLRLGLVARPPEPEDLGPVHPAPAVEAADGTRLAPALHRLGPLLRHVVLGQPLECADELAVDDPGRERIEVTGDRRHSRLVEQREALLHVAVQDEESSLGHLSDGARCRVALRPQVDRSPGPRAGNGGVTGQHPLVGADDRVPRVGRGLALAVEQVLGACEPAAHGCHERGVEQQVHRDAHRGTAGRDSVAALHTRGVGAFPRLDRDVEPTRGVGDLAEHGEIGRGQRAVRVRRHEEIERLRPLAARRRLVPTFQVRCESVAHRAPPLPVISPAPPAHTDRNPESSPGNRLGHAEGMKADESNEKGDNEMPLINVKVIEGVFAASQKREIVEKLTEAMVEIEGENMRPVTWCVIEEVRSGDWAIGGQPLTTEDVQELAARQPVAT